MKLYGYFRSGASYRVRIALHIKGLPYESISVHLTRNGGEQHSPLFRSLSPQSLVPVLAADDARLCQSLAIIEFLEEKYPSPPLLPKEAERRAYVRQLAQLIACDVHPLNNLRVLEYLTGTLGMSNATKMQWVTHWMTIGLGALEETVVASTYAGNFCCGDVPTVADCCLVPQLFSARRFAVDLTPFPRLCQIEEKLQDLPAFQAAHPSQQVDAE